MFEFLAHHRGDRTVVRLADGESGLSARTIARRLSSVSGLYACLVAQGTRRCRPTRCRGLLTGRAGGSRRSRTVPQVRVPRPLPRILAPKEADRLVAALRTHRDRAMVLGDAAGRAAAVSQEQALAGSCAAFTGHTARDTGALRADLLLGSATARNSSASQRHDRQKRSSAPRT